MPVRQGEVMLAEPVYRKAAPEDLPGIAKFRKAFFEDNPVRSHSAEYYNWKCFRNPFRQGEIWLAENGRAVVGMKSMVPKRIKVLDKVVTGAETGDTFTHPDYRRQGIFTSLFKAAAEGGLDLKLDFIYGTPNLNSLPGYEKKLNYARVPIELHTRVKIIESKKLLASRLRLSFLASIIAPVIDTFARIMFDSGIRGIKKTDCRITSISTFPSGIDSLWNLTSGDFDVMIERKTGYLEWRYVNNPDTYTIMIAVNSSGEISGYIVTKAAQINGIATGFICDFLAVQDDPGVFKKLVAEAVKDFRRKQVSLISGWVVKGNFYDKVLSRLGFLPSTGINLVCFKNDLGNRVLGGKYRWHFTMGDSDNI
jgi:hypothetical protein